MKKSFIIVSFLLTITLTALFYLKIDQNEPVLSEQNSLILPNSQKEPESYLKITFLDVEQGDSILVESINGEKTLVDCGADARVLEALGRVMSFYDKQIDYLFVTHPDLDHYGGCVDVLKRFEVKNIVYTGLQKNDGAWQTFWQYVQNEGSIYHEINKEQEWKIGEVDVRFLYPDHDISADARVPGIAKISDNNASLVFKLSFGENDVLFTGDMEADLENYLVEKYAGDLETEVLKVGHHGSGSSSGQGFLETVSPRYGIISVGANNDYGHPSLRVLKRLERAGSKVWRTDKTGDITFKISKSNIVIE